MEPKKPRSKTLVVSIVIVIVLASIVAYYTAAIRTRDRRPRNVTTEGMVYLLSER